MSRTIIDDTTLQHLGECFRIVQMIEELRGEPFMSITLHSYDASIRGQEHAITIEGCRPAPEPCHVGALESYEAQYYGRSLGECLEQAVAAKKARDE
ncbi:hypothetical protein LCGC14_2239680 [marine sediment metagenome]|uniref:Uncharacterized protein n=1 Tax=marine sediment metagenome TaxID=412755 RepID=A0A0F9FID2_9ZZZZ